MGSTLACHLLTEGEDWEQEREEKKASLHLSVFRSIGIFRSTDYKTQYADIYNHCAFILKIHSTTRYFHSSIMAWCLQT